MKLMHFLQANKEAIAKLSSNIHSALPSLTTNITLPTTKRQVKKDYSEAVANAERRSSWAGSFVTAFCHAARCALRQKPTRPAKTHAAT